MVLLVWYGWSTYSTAAGLRREARNLEEPISQLVDEEKSASQRYNALESKQRRERQHYSGEQAVMASSEVMKAKETYEDLNARLERMQQQHTELQTSAASLQLRIVPVIAIALLHLFGFFMIRPQHESG